MDDELKQKNILTQSHKEIGWHRHKDGILAYAKKKINLKMVLVQWEVYLRYREIQNGIKSFFNRMARL